jgi:hypothetical protein
VIGPEFETAAEIVHPIADDSTPNSFVNQRSQVRTLSREANCLFSTSRLHSVDAIALREVPGLADAGIQNETA